MAGNLNTLIVLRVLDQDTAEMLTRMLPEIEVQALKTRSGATDSSVPAISVDFVSTTLDEVATQRVPLLTPADLISLPKGQAFALLEGGQLWKIRLPLLEARDDPAGFARRLADLFYHYGFEVTGIARGVERLNAPAQPHDSAGLKFSRALYAPAAKYFLAAITIRRSTLDTGAGG